MEHSNAVDRAYFTGKTNSLANINRNDLVRTEIRRLPTTGFKTRKQEEADSKLNVKMGEANRRILAKAVDNVWRPELTASQLN